MRKIRLCVFLPAVLSFLVFVGACSSPSAEYSWSSLESGEYLFAYDIGECGELARQALAASGALDPSGAATGSPEFFVCMRDRGYYLVDPETGLPRDGIAAVSGVPRPPQASR